MAQFPIKQIIIGYNIYSVFRPIGLNMVRFCKSGKFQQTTEKTDVFNFTCLLCKMTQLGQQIFGKNDMTLI